jgi:GGDEF domain-containing protein
MENRLDEAWREWINSAVPFGLLWINVDQAAMLRKTHGRDASEAMLAIVERTLLHGLRPTEILGRWGTHEFLVLCHERTPEMLEAHAHHSADWRALRIFAGGATGSVSP